VGLDITIEEGSERIRAAEERLLRGHDHEIGCVCDGCKNGVGIPPGKAGAKPPAACLR
jgi:hypothetical protein